MNTVKPISNHTEKLIKEILTTQYGKHSWSLLSCYKAFLQLRPIPPSSLARISDFCNMVDSKYPLTVATFKEYFKGSRNLSMDSYFSAVRRETERKKQFILSELEKITSKETQETRSE